MTTFNDIWPCWHAHGWESAIECSMQDATRYTRAEAHKGYWVESGEAWTAISVWKRHIRALTRQEKYEWWVEHYDWRDPVDGGGGWDEHPPEVPADWEADAWDEEMPSWQFVHRSHPDAIPTWVCGLRSDGAPHRPAAPTLKRDGVTAR